MSKISELITQYCPDGVDFKMLGEVGTFTRGNGLQKKDFVDEGVGCIHYGQIYTFYKTSARVTKSFVTPELAATLKKANPGDLVITTTSENLEDVCTAVAWLGDDPIAIGGHSCVFKHDLDPMYAAYYFQTEQFETQKRKFVTGTKVKDIKATNIGRIRIPVPDLTVQRRIVDVLGKMETLQVKLKAELEAELQARTHQYEHYRDHVLRMSSSVPIGQLRDFVDFSNARAHEKLVDPAGTVALMTARFISRGEANRFVRPEDVRTPAYEGDVALVMSDLPNGRALAKTFYVDSNNTYAANQRVCLLRSRDPSVLLPRFLQRVMDRNPQLLAYNNGMDQTHLKKDDILAVRIPVPPTEDQERVVAILDHLDSVSVELAGGIASELSARRKQYEYYRDKLLTFEERVA